VDKLESIANTADLLESLGAPVELSKSTAQEEAELIDRAIRGKTVSPLQSSLPAALGVSAFLKAYGQARAFDVAEIRAALTNKLLEIANCGDPRYELKAIELLGKHSDVGLFTERSEVTVRHTNPDSLQQAILERVKRLLNAEVVEMKPLGMDLDEELGIADAEFSEILENMPPPHEEDQDECDDL